MGPGQYSTSVYRAGELAFTHLVNDYGWAAVIDYWNTPGTHQQRFRAAYGTSPDEWEARFHKDACRRGLYLEFDNINQLGNSRSGLPRYVLSFVNIDNPGWNNALYHIDAIRLAPDIVFDEFLRQIDGQEGLSPSDTAPPYGFGWTFIDHPVGHTIAKNCGAEGARAADRFGNFDVVLSAEAKIFGEWHTAYIVLGNWRNEGKLPWKAESTDLSVCLGK